MSRQRGPALPVLSDERAVDHAVAAARFTADEARVDWHDEALWFVREKRDSAAASLPEWEELRALASAIKEHTLSHLDEYLERFEANAIAHGIQVHWARDAEEHNLIVHGILAAHGARKLVKSKSMLTEECRLNPWLEAHGIEVIDTDLGEHIVQLRREAPSHIVLPAIHLKKEEIGATFHEHLGTPAGLTDPTALTAAAREHLRRHFLSADAALTGVNFAIAETGGFVVCTNEGNADLGAHLAPVHIATMGIEKVIPRLEDLPVFLRLLTRSATGQPLTVYTSHFHRPRPGGELHLALVDNGRSKQLGREGFWRSLKCIRCGACMNTCPVYRRSGGHSYGATVPGPIGSVLTPGFDLERYASLPFASTLCGSCTAVCPVQIDLDAQLYRWRQLVTDAGYSGAGKSLLVRSSARLLSRPGLFRAVGAAARTALRLLPRALTRPAAGNWGRGRDLPEAPERSFHAWYRENRKTGGATVSSRDDILGAVRAARPTSTPWPDVRQTARSFTHPPGDSAERFAEVAAAAGARVLHAPRLDLPHLVSEGFRDARRVLSLSAAVPGNVQAPRDPHDLADLDLLICEAILGVAENGAVWLPESRVGTRAALFLPAHVLVVLDRTAIVGNLHEAYERVNVAGEGFGAFVAGPSKTADIEQSLVVGAHGPRALTIILTQ